MTFFQIHFGQGQVCGYLDALGGRLPNTPTLAHSTSQHYVSNVKNPR